jgi:hypothetical protein
LWIDFAPLAPGAADADHRGMTTAIPQSAITRFKSLEESARRLNLALRDAGERWRAARDAVAQHRAYRDRLMRERHVAYAGRGAVGPGGVLPRGDAAEEHRRAVERTDQLIIEAQSEVDRLAEEQQALEARWQAEAALVERCRTYLVAAGALREPLRSDRTVQGAA